MGTRAMGKMLELNHTLSVLDLWGLSRIVDNYVGPEGAKELALGLSHNHSLAILILRTLLLSLIST